jgi:hypothetical protein
LRLAGVHGHHAVGANALLHHPTQEGLRPIFDSITNLMVYALVQHPAQEGLRLISSSQLLFRRLGR